MITVLFTCYNRADKTERCIRSIVGGNPELEFSFVVLDDASTDRTVQMLEQLQSDGTDITVLHGNGSSFWAGGMRKAIAYAKKHTSSDYYLLVNDDVDFRDGALEHLVREYEALAAEKNNPVLVGPTCDEEGKFTYGGIRYDKGIHYIAVTPDMADKSCDTFNMNCILLNRELFMEGPEFDPCYVHGLADFDYGLALRRRNVPVVVAGFYIGCCRKNSTDGTWLDKRLPRRVRLRKKESPKGAPFKQWFHFLRKNFGMRMALLHGFTPFIRILIGR